MVFQELSRGTFLLKFSPINFVMLMEMVHYTNLEFGAACLTWLCGFYTHDDAVCARKCKIKKCTEFGCRRPANKRK